MYGEGSGPRPKMSAARSARHHRRHRPELLAALDVVEPLEVALVTRVGEQRAVAERARAVLAAALEPGDDAVAGETLGHRLGDVVGPLVRHAGGRSTASTSASVHPRPRSAPGIGLVRSPSARATWSAPPSAVPESPAAGCTHTSSYGLSSNSRVFATQLSATPPASVSTPPGVLLLRAPEVWRCSQPASSSSTSSSRVCTLAARSACVGRPLLGAAALLGQRAPVDRVGAEAAVARSVRTARRSSSRNRGRP